MDAARVERSDAGALRVVVLRFGSGDLVVTEEPVFRGAVFAGVRVAVAPGDTRGVVDFPVADCLGREKVTVAGGATGVLFVTDGATGGGAVTVTVPMARVGGVDTARGALPRRWLIRRITTVDSERQRIIAVDMRKVVCRSRFLIRKRSSMNNSDARRKSCRMFIFGPLLWMFGCCKCIRKNRLIPELVKRGSRDPGGVR